MTATELYDELWRKILEIGVKDSNFTYKDLCCVSISCRRLHRLSDEPSLWSLLLSSDFPQQTPSPSPSSSSPKSLYKIRFERERDKRVAAHRRVVLRKQSQIAEYGRKIREIESRLHEETERLQTALSEVSNLHKVRQASVALNVWQPAIIHSRQKEIVEQNAVPVETRLHTLEMELRLCKQQIGDFQRTHRNVKQRLETAKEELESMKYHPLRDFNSTHSGFSESKRKRETLKSSINFPNPLMQINFNHQDKLQSSTSNDKK